MKFIEEKAKQISVSGEYDVIVVGGGIAGIAAALAAARNGAASVLLIEKQFGLGGLATLGLITIYLPICDGRGRQVSFGLAEELFRLSIKHGCEKAYPKAWLENGSAAEREKQRFCVQYNANVFSIVVEQKLLECGVELLYGTYACGVMLEGDRITSVIVENKSGRSAVTARKVIDVTGDADLFVYANSPTKLYSNKNPLAAWYYYNEGGNLRLNQLGAADSVSDLKESGYFGGPSDLSDLHFGGVDAEELSEMVIESHKALLNSFLKNGGISEGRSLTMVASIPQVRMTRKIVGATTLDEIPFVEYEDSIGMIGDWRKRGPVFEIPFSTMHNGHIRNLLTAGRSISVTDEMWDVTRVIPGCAITGEAAGTAAALTDDFPSMDIERLQTTLRRNGGKLHLSDIP